MAAPSSSPFLQQASIFFIEKLRLVDSRPAITETSIHNEPAPQTINARLWQDPFEAVDKQLRKRDRGKECQDTRDCASPPLSVSDGETLVLGVTVSGAPYSEDAEQRRRARYAVLSGLERAGFVPEDARHIGYFFWQLGEAPPREEAWRFIASPLPTFAWPRQFQHYRQLLQPNEITWERSVIPYEGFERPSPTLHAANQRVLVLWLNEEILKGRPLNKLSELMMFLGRPNGGRVKIIGPYSSDMLREMVKDTAELLVGLSVDKACERTSRQDRWPGLRNVWFYAYGASASDDQLLDHLGGTCETVQRYFGQFGIHVQRTIATDDTLAQGIATELRKRRVEPSDAIALISEWDTFFGRTLPQAVERQLVSTGLDPRSIHKFTYLRGLDGLLPSIERRDDRKEDNATSPKEKQTGVADFFKAEGDTKTLERPIGQSQFDYLRRISNHLHKIDDDLRKEGPLKRIKAIGILGSDVFDKLLVLRALRPQFPEALFFTTDFDEALTIKSELPFTRNLIISSSFGPNLSEKFQGEIPDFRDTYQTSAFLATLSAIGDPAKNWETPQALSTHIANQLNSPRLFEVSRNGDILSFPWEGPPLPARERQYEDLEEREVRPDSASVLRFVNERTWQTSKPNAWPCWADADSLGCGYIQPVNMKESEKLEGLPAQPKIIEPLYPTFEKSSRLKLAGGLAAIAVLGLAAFCFRNVRKQVGFEAGLVVLGFSLGAAACLFWEDLAQFLTGYGDGEPLALLQGVSVWPTVLLRSLGIVLAVCFLLRARRRLGENLEEIAADMKLNRPIHLKRRADFNRPKPPQSSQDHPPLRVFR